MITIIILEEGSMANKYAGTKTEKNLLEAFSGESQARNKYTFFASAARKAGYEQIAALFEKTADNEKEHAKLWFKELGLLGNTAENLEAGAAGENYEWTSRRYHLGMQKLRTHCHWNRSSEALPRVQASPGIL